MTPSMSLSEDDDVSSSYNTNSEELVVIIMEGKQPTLLKARKKAGLDDDNSIRFHGRNNTGGPCRNCQDVQKNAPGGDNWKGTGG